MEEIWKNIDGYDGWYQVSTFGRIRSIIGSKNNIRKLGVTKNGYLCVDLYKDGFRVKYKVHILVAEAFIPNPDNKPEVNHKDSNRLNCHVTNLEWVTTSENALHAYKFGRKVTYVINLGKFGADHPRSKKVYQLSLEGQLINTFDSITQAEQVTGVKRTSIYACVDGRTKTGHGFIWTCNYEGEMI